MITDAEAAALLGASSTQRTGPTQKNRLVDCKWDDGQGGFLLVTLAQGAEFYGPDITNPGWKPVSGLGDMAFEDDATQIVGFIQGTSVVTLYVAFHDTAMADIVTEAKLAAGRL